MKQYKYVITCTKTVAARNRQNLGSTLGTDPEFSRDTEIFEWEYETNTPLQIGEIISTAGWGCYEVRAIYRWVDIGERDPENRVPISLIDSNRYVNKEGQHILYVLTREVDYLLLTKGVHSDDI
ncbi:hypothetical protein [Sphaerothrix gracilis]|uniref:hypothetical protein n=1 Tax=Sphaerothrix gracilis TaxID=3151835 RepID=UPI0031FDBBF8